MSSARDRFQVLTGGKPERGSGFVCTWCGATFARQYTSSDGVMSLEEHHATDPRCKRNKGVNNPTLAKNGFAEVVSDVPGEATLHRVRVKAGCDHPEELREILFASDGRGGWTNEAVGWRCGNCYGEYPMNEWKPSE